MTRVRSTTTSQRLVGRLVSAREWDRSIRSDDVSIECRKLRDRARYDDRTLIL